MRYWFDDFPLPKLVEEHDTAGALKESLKVDLHILCQEFPVNSWHSMFRPTFELRSTVHLSLGVQGVH